MFETDFPCTLIKVTFVSFGYGWELIYELQFAAMNIRHCDPRPIYATYESLRALKRASHLEGYRGYFLQ